MSGAYSKIPMFRWRTVYPDEPHYWLGFEMPFLRDIDNSGLALLEQASICVETGKAIWEPVDIEMTPNPD